MKRVEANKESMRNKDGRIKENKESMRKKDGRIKEKLMEALCSRGPGVKPRPVEVVFENFVSLFS